MTKVVALERGHDGKTIREINEEFDIVIDPKATWYAEVKTVAVEPEPAPVARKGRPPKHSDPDPSDPI